MSMEDGEGDRERELQLLPRKVSAPQFTPWTSTPTSKSAPAPDGTIPDDDPHDDHLDLSLSIGVLPLSKPCWTNDDDNRNGGARSIQALKWHAAEQIRLAAMEKAYAERVRELTRREMEMAEKEFARARLLWERAREEVDKVERMKEMATRMVSPTCTEVTCQACRQRFRP
ncbi:hypothetical protein Taro_018620 [Colocasia esculenta]|uniref:Uncharacterized protein n=1 Tax=Colocasia esculenta TaxID=4460 RepID=A0A843UUE6_COLES|nr:hypothetical protein [Colocasia esculenta]